MEGCLNPGRIAADQSRHMASLSRISQCKSSVMLESKDLSFSWQRSSTLGLSDVLSRVRTRGALDCRGFSSDRRHGLREHRIAGNSERFWRPRVAGLGIQSALGGRKVFGEKPRIWRWREQGVRVRCTALGHSHADDEDSFIEEQESVGDVTESLPPSQPSTIASWVFRLWKVDWARVIFGLSREEKPWTVPWTGQTIFQVMFLWFAAFWLVGSWIIPIAAQAAGFSKQSLTYRGQALYSLITDIAEGTVGLGILHRCLSRFHPLPGEWFPVSWKGTWYVEACLGCLMFPLVNRLSQLNLDLLPFPAPFSSSHVEQSIMARDPIATLLYAVVVSVCAPIWEEVMFRGFLLPSLTRYLPVWGSIIVSAIAFALAHFSLQRMLPLTFLGLVMGIVFVRSRNLLASMLLHSLWNGFVFLDLLR
ncbi:hypothetical protein KC19_9G031700 [Ceratodon purpureus]|uniref:CAAX prenyl protease 2/Lysostaphin resistance protein A-like domain-containing protein n=1 Tax=Ceratodon purpureus TaxID=3225 RepID=A0A8T0GS83_CERPU|nr:hypothetical protein KC19_9G031700 [Ceratodon purpureus]